MVEGDDGLLHAGEAFVQCGLFGLFPGVVGVQPAGHLSYGHA
jgi:hypothetical protein